MKIKIYEEKAKASAPLGNDGEALRLNNAQKVRKKKSKGQLEKKTRRKAEQRQNNARGYLQRTMNNLHALTKGHHARLGARRWVEVQIDAKSINGHVANELWHFLKDRELGRFNRGTIEKEDLSEEAKSAWVRYLKELAIPAGVPVDVDAVFAVGGTDEEASNALEVGAEEDNRVMLSPEPPAMEDEAATEGEDDEDGGVTLGPLAFRPKQKEK